MGELHFLMLSSAFLGFFHTLIGPDHYLPFIVLSKARKWSQSKTLWITFVSGIGHVGGSVILGILGVALGISISKLEAFELQRVTIVGWLLMAFGLLYSIYGIKKYLSNGGHFHLPHFLIPKRIRNLYHLTSMNDMETNHEHQHKHHHEHAHTHNQQHNHPVNHVHKHDHQPEDITNITPWILFLIFVFGPCEVLIPLVIFPASEHNTIGVIAVSIVFGIATIATMMLTVLLGFKGISLVKFKNGEKYFHLIAGLVILTTGVGMHFFGW